MQAVAQNVIESLKKAGAKMVGEEGLIEGRWVVLDWGDVVVHVFDEPLRSFYDLERLWIHGEEVPVPEE